jgi:hypothetical protein
MSVIIFFTVFIWKINSLIKKEATQELEDQRGALKRLFGFFLFTYIIRLGTMCGIGYFYLIMPSMFWRQELYIVLTFISDAPSIIFFYMTHRSSFVI